jgi:cephalosporin hydroxylase
MIEIGCGHGGSLRMWKQYLGPFAQIVGVDIRPVCRKFEEQQVAVRIGDQSDPEFLSAVVDEFGPIDIVLDDGSHRMDHIHASFRALYQRLSPNGVYMVEDLQTAYQDRYGGGLGRDGTFMETFKDLIDELHADYTDGAAEATDFTRSTVSMHVYDGLVVFERGRHLHKHAPNVGRIAQTDP